MLPRSYEIDHYIPRKVFEAEGRKDLEIAYVNLMYACPVCNRAKGDMFSGKIESGKIENELFYNPVTEDMNDHFYRDEDGGILSDEDKGKDIIGRLYLYRPSKRLGWYLDRLKEMQIQTEELMESETDSERKKELEIANNRICAELYKKSRIFVQSYAERG